MPDVAGTNHYIFLYSIPNFEKIELEAVGSDRQQQSRTKNQFC